MQEKTIVKALSGTEVQESILAKIRQQMQRDCTLRPIEAYPAFSFDAHINIRFQGTRTDHTSLEVSGDGGEVDPETEWNETSVDVSQKEAPPNKVREEADLGIPTVTTNPATGKPEEKLVKRVQYVPTKKGK